MKGFLIVGLAMLAWSWGRAVEARFITIEANVNASVEGDNARTLITISNRGDEPAYNVVARAEIGGAARTGLVREALLPNERYSETFDTTVDYDKPGRYPVIVTVDYTDGNHYPFSALSIVHLNYRENIAGRVVGEIGPASVGSRGSVRLTIRNLGQTEERVNARLVTPTELSASPATKTLRVKPSGQEDLAFTVRNASALPGSQYQVYAVLDYEQDNYHFSTVVGGRVSVEARRSALSVYLGPAIAAAIVLTGAWAYIHRRRRPRRSVAA
jgi:hypothetical protein